MWRVYDRNSIAGGISGGVDLFPGGGGGARGGLVPGREIVAAVRG